MKMKDDEVKYIVSNLQVGCKVMYRKNRKIDSRTLELGTITKIDKCYNQGKKEKPYCGNCVGIISINNDPCRCFIYSGNLHKSVITKIVTPKSSLFLIRKILNYEK